MPSETIFRRHSHYQASCGGNFVLTEQQRNQTADSLLHLTPVDNLVDCAFFQ